MAIKQFDVVKLDRPNTNKFNLKHERKLTLNMGQLVPILAEEMLPGDSWRCNSAVFLRFLALVAPVMHNVDVYVHYFAVPYRLVDSLWQEFIVDTQKATDFVKFRPKAVADIGAQFFKPGSLLDHLGFPVSDDGSCDAAYDGLANENNQYSGYLVKGYQLIWDQYYRDENLQDDLETRFNGEFLTRRDISDNTTGNASEYFLLRNRAWEKDYLTSSLPFAQKGEEVIIPMDMSFTYKKPSILRSAATGLPFDDAEALKTNTPGELQGFKNPVNFPVYLDNIDAISGSSLTVNALRASVRLQEWMEKSARGGTRYTEAIRAHFGVHSSDARLQRAEYLGGGKQPVVISEVLQTAPPTAEGATPVAQMAGHGLSVGSTNQFSYFAEEHCMIFGIVSVMPTTAYQQAMQRKWLRRSFEDYYWPSFAHLGEQQVLKKEAYTDWNNAAIAPNIEEEFGYQSRYAEYKYIPNTVHGQFRTTLGFWHLGRVFAGIQQLNEDFIVSDPRSDIFAVETDVDHLVCQVFHRIDALRPIPYFSVPKL